MTTPIPHLEEAMVELRKVHPSGSFAVGYSYPYGYTATLHIGGMCYLSRLAGKSRTASECVADALSQIPAPEDAAKERLARAWAELRAAEAAAGEVGHAAP